MCLLATWDVCGLLIGVLDKLNSLENLNALFERRLIAVLLYGTPFGASFEKDLAMLERAVLSVLDLGVNNCSLFLKTAGIYLGPAFEVV